MGRTRSSARRSADPRPSFPPAPTARAGEFISPDLVVHDGDVAVVKRSLATEADRDRLVEVLVDLIYNDMIKETQR